MKKQIELSANDKVVLTIELTGSSKMVKALESVISGKTKLGGGMQVSEYLAMAARS